MTYIHRDPSGDRLEIEGLARGGDSLLCLDAYQGGEWTTIHVPLAQLEALINGMREEARTASEQAA